MRPKWWQPAIEPTVEEQRVLKRIKRAKLFVFLRVWRHRIFDEGFQAELAATYPDSPKGHPPIPPAQLALATLLQAYTGVSDDEVIEATTMDRRWQLVLDWLDRETAPFSKGTLVGFRQRLIAAELDRRLIERTIEVAREVADQPERFDAKALRLALDSSPLWGAGRVEDTYNLVGHALRLALSVIARQQGRELTALMAEVGPAARILDGSSLKAALDGDWDDPAMRTAALGQVVAALEAVASFVTGLVEAPAVAERAEEPIPERALSPETVAAAQAGVAVALQVQAQDVERDASGAVRLKRGVARDRRISVTDAQMRHGRKSRRQRVDGYKRHVVRDLDQGLIRAVGLTPANAPDASVTEAIKADLMRQTDTVSEWHLDRGYLASSLVRDRSPTTTIYCKAWLVRNGSGFPKTAFTLDWEQQRLYCPNGIAVDFKPGQTVHFPQAACASCAYRAQCTSSPHGRSVAIHPDEQLLEELRARQLTAEGRAKLRERVGVEHALAHIGHWQGDRARYLGQRKNLFDLRRCAVIENLHRLAALPAFAIAA